MNKKDNSKRTFLKKAAAALGVVAAADYTSALISARSDSTKEANANYVKDVDLQEKAWLQKQLVLMSDNEKTQMLDEILNIQNRDHA